jgi:hypothetical protein
VGSESHGSIGQVDGHQDDDPDHEVSLSALRFYALGR